MKKSTKNKAFKWLVIIASILVIGGSVGVGVSKLNDKYHLKHDYEYTSNGNNKHIATCVDEDCQKSFEEKCNFKDGECTLCGGIEVELPAE